MSARGVNSAQRGAAPEVAAHRCRREQRHYHAVGPRVPPGGAQLLRGQQHGEARERRQRGGVEDHLRLAHRAGDAEEALLLEVAGGGVCEERQRDEPHARDVEVGRHRDVAQAEERHASHQQRSCRVLLHVVAPPLQHRAQDHGGDHLARFEHDARAVVQIVECPGGGAAAASVPEEPVSACSAALPVRQVHPRCHQRRQRAVILRSEREKQHPSRVRATTHPPRAPALRIAANQQLQPGAHAKPGGGDERHPATEAKAVNPAGDGRCVSAETRAVRRRRCAAQHTSAGALKYALLKRREGHRAAQRPGRCNVSRRHTRGEACDAAAPG